MKKLLLQPVIFSLLTILFGACDNSKVEDIVGRAYKTVKIGNQIWMAENLNVEHYRNGDPIPQVQNKDEWAQLKKGAWCYYDNDPSNGKIYGKLYNWYAVNDPRGLAPKGWHIPINEEFEILWSSVNNNGNALKLIGEGRNYGAGTNTSGFSALLAGFRDFGGGFYGLGYNAYFWSSTENDATSANRLNLRNDDSGINLHYNYKGYGFSVRCLRD